MTLQELMQAAQDLSWQEQFHLAARLLQWAEAKMPMPNDGRQDEQDRALVTAASHAAEASFATVWDNPEDAAYDDL